MMKFAEFINLWFACLAVDGAPGSLLTFDCKVRTVMMMGTRCGRDQQKIVLLDILVHGAYTMIRFGKNS